MSRILLNLRHVPADEADEIRALLDEHGIDWYETDVGRWGISFAGIWLRDESQLQQVESLLDAYQRGRQQAARQQLHDASQDGSEISFTAELRRNPLRLLLAAAGILLVLALSALPILLLAR